MFYVEVINPPTTSGPFALLTRRREAPVKHISVKLPNVLEGRKVTLSTSDPTWSARKEGNLITFSGGRLEKDQSLRFDVEVKGFVDPENYSVEFMLTDINGTTTTVLYDWEVKFDSIQQLLKTFLNYRTILEPMLIITTLLLGIGTIAPHFSILNRAQKISEKLNKKLEVKNYEGILEELDKLIELIERAISSDKLCKEINEPPYSILENLQSIKKTLSEKKIVEKTIDKILKEPEIKAYLWGIKCVLKTFQNLKDLKIQKKEDTTSEFFIAFMSESAKVFDKINLISKAPFKDFWFIWEKDEYEPIRIFFENGRIVKARYRWHWKHYDIPNPYVDDGGRIEVFFLPHFHTPLIRRLKEDICFIVFAKCYGAKVHTYEVVSNLEIDPYYTKKGWKTEHPPAVFYSGW